MPAIQVTDLHKSFVVGDQTVPVLKNVNFEIKEGEFNVIFGPSGSGKSTLLHAILGLEEPTKGTVKILGTNIYQNKDENDRSEFRKRNMGMVYQQSNWVKSLNVIKNVSLPLMLLGVDESVRIKNAQEMLKMIKMEKWAENHPSELSSGQQQKVSLARALITDPKVIIADEPTGNLDLESGTELMKMLKDLSKRLNKTILMVTHDLMYLKYADRAFNVIDGQLKTDVSKENILKEYTQNAF